MKNETFLSGEYEHLPNTWDEMFDENGKIRESYSAFHSLFSKIPLHELDQMNDFAMQFFKSQGITFNVYSDEKGVEKIFPFDIIPRIINHKEWRLIEKGIIQRIKALNHFLKDIYHDQFILKDNVIPASLVASNENYLREMRNLPVPSDIYSHISGIDLIRDEKGKFCVLEDNLRTPSGVSYMLENREISRSLYPSLMPENKVMQVINYPQMLYDQLNTLSNKKHPVIVLLTPGYYNSAYYEHASLARLMGIELVEGNDLVIDNHFVYMKMAGGLKKVDIIYRRIDDNYLDPLNFNSESVLGIAGIMDIYRQGNVIIVNAPGTGVADDKATYIYVPEMISYYLNEKPILNNIKTYQMANEDEKKYVIENIEKMVIKRTDGSGGYGMIIGETASEMDIEKYISKVRKAPSKFIAQPILRLSTTPCIFENNLSPRCVDLRPFAIYGKNEIKVTPGGLSRVAMKKGSLIVNSSQGGGSKDTWIIKNR